MLYVYAYFHNIYCKSICLNMVLKNCVMLNFQLSLYLKIIVVYTKFGKR